MDCSNLKVGESNGAEEIDELFIEAKGRASLHVERMARNEYCLIFECAEKRATVFIGHWPQDYRKRGKLLLNVVENEGGKWHY